MSNRDDFTPTTRDTLRKRAGDKCSNPSCLAPTSGPSSDPYGKLNGGWASHICAAAPGGKRYDQRMTPEQRSDINNGIWLCQGCAIKIDQDEYLYTVELLHEWKSHSEEVARKNFNKSQFHRGSWDTEAEVRKCEKFIKKILPTISEINDFLLYGETSISGETHSQVLYYGSKFGVHGWSNKNQYWSFSPEIKSRQEHLLNIFSCLAKKIINWRGFFNEKTRRTELRYPSQNFYLSDFEKNDLESVQNLMRELINAFADIQNYIQKA